VFKRGYPDSAFPNQQVARLYRQQVWRRWQLVGLFWLGFGLPVLWSLRSQLALCWEYFTWAALRSALWSNFGLSVGLTFCVAITLSTLVWQSRNILWGLPKGELQNLIHQAQNLDDRTAADQPRAEEPTANERNELTDQQPDDATNG